MWFTRLELAFKLSLLTGAVWFAFVIKMFLFPTVTEEPSFINCFSFLDPTKAKLMFGGAIVISGATIILSLFRSNLAIVFIEALGLWTIAYLILVGISSSPYAVSISGVSQTLTALGFLAMLWLLSVRASLNQRATRK